MALVTGAAGGIGTTTAMLMAAEGARVAVLDRNAAGVRETVAAITTTGGMRVADRSGGS
ncbi:SDR family NAD(P)-dependent oxidoreductase [Sphingomonas sp. MMS24-JH45]